MYAHGQCVLPPSSSSSLPNHAQYGWIKLVAVQGASYQIKITHISNTYAYLVEHLSNICKYIASSHTIHTASIAVAFTLRFGPCVLVLYSYYRYYDGDDGKTTDRCVSTRYPKTHTHTRKAKERFIYVHIVYRYILDYKFLPQEK